MCGLFGSFGEHHADAGSILQRVGKILAHRGPDDSGIGCGDGWALGFRRLSIIDLSPAGHQPMRSKDGRFSLVFNGEFYNYREVRKELENEGERFTSRSDSEVLLALLARKGTKGLEKVNGMFAFAFVDTLERRFILGRDRLGVKPLYYTQARRELRFASELKGLLAWPDATRRIDPAALVEYLALNYLPSEMCILEGYKKLPPGSIMEGSLDEPANAAVRSYWSLDFEANGEAYNSAGRVVEELEWLLDDAVTIRLRSDVPVGVFLSGGIDSGLVAAFAAKSGGTPLALTVGFEEEEYNEAELARATAAHAGLPLHLLTARAGSLSDVDRLVRFYDEPFGDASALPTFMLCEAAAGHATVFLSGDGGDEAFAGYRRYIETLRHGWIGSLPGVVRSGLQFAAASLPELSPLGYRLAKTSLPDAGYAAAFDGIPQDPVLPSLLHRNLKPYGAQAGKSLWRRWEESRRHDLTTRQQALDYRLYLPDDILVKMDRASMAHSIEVRSPFLDYRIVEFAARINRSLLINRNEGKLPLRRLAERYLPGEVVRAKKRGFGVPLDDWFRENHGVALVRERLLASDAPGGEWWDRDAVAKMLVAHRSGKGRRFGGWLWRLLVLDAWARCYINHTIQVHSEF